jgi:Pyruvate/2-oxoacid:ferredoxin oxidoreductase gamma subunit
VIDTYTIKPVYGRLQKQQYPSLEEMEQMIKPFAKSITIVDSSNICDEKLGNAIYGNVMTLGVAKAAGVLPLSEKSLLKAIKETIPRAMEKNMKAFKLGLNYKKPE